MKLPRARFTVRRLMIVVAVAACFLGAWIAVLNSLGTIGIHGTMYRVEPVPLEHPFEHPSALLLALILTIELGLVVAYGRYLLNLWRRSRQTNGPRS
jgi:hypothetical protein